jgi:glyoxylase-like metal-dependent hydrolase (beta-lactamase superfamily II)
MKLHIIEGNTQRLDGGAMFGNAPKPLWQRWITPDSLNRIPMACRCLLMQTDDGQNILFETGIGNFFEPSLKERYGVIEDESRVLINLGKLGLTHHDIDIVILSHLHFDHAGGLLSAWQKNTMSELMFPNAQYWVGEAHWQQANHPHYRDKASFIPLLNELLQSSNRLVLINEDNATNLLPDVVFHFSHGHTPGLMLSEIITEQGPLIFCSDLIPGQFWVHLPICMGYDRFPELLIDEKQRLLQRLITCNGRLYFTHDDKMACGKVMQDDRMRYYVEETAL